MKITRVETLYLRLPEVKELADSGQDALVVRVETDAGAVSYTHLTLPTKRIV